MSKVLVAYATKSGSVDEIAQRIGATIAGSGASVDVVASALGVYYDPHPPHAPPHLHSAGFVLGAVRFILEIMDRAGGGRGFTSSAVRWLIDMNFLHYAILMFAICSAVLIVVSLFTPAPERGKLAGLTFATVGQKLDVTETAPRTPYKPAAETAAEHRWNVVFSALLLATVVGLWIYFR